MSQREYVEGCILVLFEKGINETQARETASSFQLDAGAWAEILRMLVVMVPLGTEQEWVDRFLELDSVETAFLNYKADLIQ